MSPILVCLRTWQDRLRSRERRPASLGLPAWPPIRCCGLRAGNTPGLAWRDRRRVWAATLAVRFWWFRVLLSLAVIVWYRRKAGWHLCCIGRELRDCLRRLYARLRKG